MGPEFHKIFKLFEELEEAGQTATLTFTSKGGKSTFKLQLESSPSSPSPTPTAASAPASTSSSPPAPGNQAAGRRRRRNRGAAARARRNQRAAASQATLAEVDPPPRLPPTPPPRPLRHLLSPSPTSGRPEMPTFFTLNLDGSSPPLPAPPPSSTFSPPLCYDECTEDQHCNLCRKCYVLCHEHSGCDCDNEGGQKHEDCKLLKLL